MSGTWGVRRGWWMLLVLALVAGCATSGASADPERAAPESEVAAARAAAAPETTVATTISTTTVPLPTTTTAPPPPPTVPREVTATGFGPYATVAEVVLHHPAAEVERIGFHESGHEGARTQTPLPTATRPFTMEERSRGTGDRTAADIVVRPDTELRAPVTGTVARGGSYTLYCDHHDEYLVIEPDAHPGWEVKLLHFEGLSVAKGQRVEAGVTPVGARARVLPFASQVEESSGTPPWPHVHVEVVDPSIPNIPSPGGGCS